MMMGRRFICVLLLLVVCLSSCKKKEHVIPRGKMAKIYAEMFITDQKLTGQPSSIRAVIDTSWVYEPIFEKYGYNSDDYRASVVYYLHDATRFARIVRRSTLIIEAEIKDLQKQKALLEKLEEAEEISYEPERVYFLTGVDNPDVFGNDTLRFYVDSTGGQLFFDPRDWADTSYYGPVMRVLEDEIIAAEAEEAEEAAEAEGEEIGEEGGEEKGDDKGAEASDSKAGAASVRGVSESSEEKSVGGKVLQGINSGGVKENSDSKAVIDEVKDGANVGSTTTDTLNRVGRRRKKTDNE